MYSTTCPARWMKGATTPEGEKCYAVVYLGTGEVLVVFGEPNQETDIFVMCKKGIHTFIGRVEQVAHDYQYEYEV